MDNKSIKYQKRILGLIILLLLLIAASFIYITRNSTNVLNTIKSNLTYNFDTKSSVQYLGGILENVETNTSIFAYTAQDSFSGKLVNNKPALEAYLSSLDNLIKHTVLKTPWTNGAWIQINPAIAGGDSSLCNWYHYEGDKLIKHKKEYKPLNEVDDAYYFEAIKAKKPIWTDVYTDPFVNVPMVTYSIPLYKDGILIGVAGMDISFEGINGILKHINADYKGSELYLVKEDSQIISSYPYNPDMVNKNLFYFKKDLSFLKYKLKQGNNLGGIGYREGFNEKIVVFSRLSNNGYLIITVPAGIIYKNFNTLIFSSYILLTILVLLTFYALLGKYKLQKAINVIQEQDALQNLIMESTGNGYILFDTEKNISLVNNTFFEMFDLPESAKEIKSGSDMRNLISQKMKNPQIFIDDTICIFDTLDKQKNIYELIDGRIIERFTLPLFKDDENIGRLCNFMDITERKYIEERLIESKKEKDLILNNILEVVSYIDKDFRIKWTNDSSERLFGIKNEEVVNNYCYSRHRNQFHNCQDCPVIETFITKLPCKVERKTSDDKYLIISAVPVFNNENEVIGAVETIVDIAEQKQVEKELILKDKLMSAVAVAINELVRTTDFDKSIISAFGVIGNAINVDRIVLFENRFDHEKNKLLTNYKQEWISAPTYSQMNYTSLKNLPIEDIPAIAESLLINKPFIANTKDIEPIMRSILEANKVFSIMLFPIYIEDYFWGYVGFDDCKNERIWSESEKAILLSFAASLAGVIERNQQKELEKNRIKQELEIALRHADLGLWYWNLQTNHVDFSDSLLKILGYEPNEVPSNISTRDNWFCEEDKDKANKVLQAYLDGKTDKYESEYRVKTKSGDIKWIFSQGEIIERDSHGKPLIMTGTYIDITERKKLQEIMLQHEKMISIGELAAGMAHEINNPLGGILLGCHNLKRRISPDSIQNIEAAKECNIDLTNLNLYLEKRSLLNVINNIQELSERAANITNDMLSFSRKSGSDMEKVNLHELLDKSVEFASSDFNLKKNFDFRQIKIIREYKDISAINCKRIEIEQVFLNLFKNAAQAMSENQTNPQIIVRSFRKGNYVRIEIEDNGKGMDEMVKKRAFEPFYTTKETGIGTGLGLSVSYFVIKNTHKGNIFFESTPGKGTKFVVDLPINPNS